MQPQYPQYPQYPQQPAAPAQPQYPPQQYAQPAPQYAQPAYPQYPAYAPPVPPPAPTVAGSLEDFFDQPSTGNKAWVFNGRPIGTTYRGIVARAIVKSDIRQQTDQSGRPQTFRDGRPKFVMVVPMLVQPDQEFPEGEASWWVKGKARDELVRAMAEAGAPVGPPEAGAAISVTLTGMRPIPGMNPAFQYRIAYARPAGAPPAPAANSWPAETANVPGMPGPTAAPWTPDPQQPTHVPGMEGQPIPALNIGPTVTPPVAPANPAPAMAPSSLTAEQQELLARLTGG